MNHKEDNIREDLMEIILNAFLKTNQYKVTEEYGSKLLKLFVILICNKIKIVVGAYILPLTETVFQTLLTFSVIYPSEM